MGRWTKCIVLKEGVGLKEVRRMVSEITSDVLIIHKLWYSLKYEQGMVMELEGDGDLRMFLKGNAERGYLHVGDSDRPKRRAQKAMWSYNHGIVCERSGKDRDDMGVSPIGALVFPSLTAQVDIDDVFLTVYIQIPLHLPTVLLSFANIIHSGAATVNSDYLFVLQHLPTYR
ncbi:hypothetical protein Cgig2_005935 [Carnegiea gigantea]|uniref:Uncharacterized protein n=1 Tax=Carnegiea gigantea TaxID=171969 RepID=A0A9Q1KJC0_9CARY|nr:hypothetical protein Cgig2_005935 [Carnegiea gigantea]